MRSAPTSAIGAEDILPPSDKRRAQNESPTPSNAAQARFNSDSADRGGDSNKRPYAARAPRNSGPIAAIRRNGLLAGRNPAVRHTAASIKRSAHRSRCLIQTSHKPRTCLRAASSQRADSCAGSNPLTPKRIACADSPLLPQTSSNSTSGTRSARVRKGCLLCL